MSAQIRPAAGLGERQVTTADGLVVTVRDVPAASRFDAWVGDALVGNTTYRRGEKELIVMSTTTEEAWRERGIGSAMTEAILGLIRDARWKVAPRCPFTSDYLAGHPDQMDLVADRYRKLVRRSYRPAEFRRENSS